jgi:quercetin dioxygenase-like cupin family protein
VPPEHAQRIVEVLAKNGNGSAKAVVIPGVDHSFQTTPGDEDERFRERYSLASFARPYDQRLYAEMLLWLRKHAPTRSAGHSAAEVAEVLGASRAEQPTVRPGTEINSTARSAPEHAPKSETTPARTVLSPGVEIIADVTDAASTAGVETLEGRIGPLLLAEGCQAHFIDMPGGMFVEEHPHSTESIIYTVRGQWVLCSRGRRQLMKPGSLFRFTAGTPTGYEVPFADSAFILIFKGDRVTKVEAEFIEYLRGMAARLDAEHKKGTAFKLSELPADHPARAFARRVNPKFEPK